MADPTDEKQPASYGHEGLRASIALKHGVPAELVRSQKQEDDFRGSGYEVIKVMPCDDYSALRALGVERRRSDALIDGVLAQAETYETTDENVLERSVWWAKVAFKGVDFTAPGDDADDALANLRRGMYASLDAGESDATRVDDRGEGVNSSAGELGAVAKSKSVPTSSNRLDGAAGDTKQVSTDHPGFDKPIDTQTPVPSPVGEREPDAERRGDGLFRKPPVEVEQDERPERDREQIDSFLAHHRDVILRFGAWSASRGSSSSRLLGSAIVVLSAPAWSLSCCSASCRTCCGSSSERRTATVSSEKRPLVLVDGADQWPDETAWVAKADAPTWQRAESLMGELYPDMRFDCDRSVWLTPSDGEDWREVPPGTDGAQEFWVLLVAEYVPPAASGGGGDDGR